jgi:hypothetical protein
MAQLYNPEGSQVAHLLSEKLLKDRDFLEGAAIASENNGHPMAWAWLGAFAARLLDLIDSHRQLQGSTGDASELVEVREQLAEMASEALSEASRLHYAVFGIFGKRVLRLVRDH